MDTGGRFGRADQGGAATTKPDAVTVNVTDGRLDPDVIPTVYCAILAGIAAVRG